MDGHYESPQGEFGLFGRPLFKDPAALALSRVGVVDVGSNSVRMVVFDGAARSPAYFYNEKVMAGLGVGVSETGMLNPEGRRRALSALRRFQMLAVAMDAAPLTAVATAAVREAEDGQDFIDEVMRTTGLKLWVIPGEEEARLSAQGVLLGWPDASGLVCDIGGSSMELAELTGGAVGTCVTSPLGPQRLQSIKGKKTRKKHIRSVIEGMAAQMHGHQDRLYLVGGSWRAIARLDMERRGYPLHVQHEYRMTPKAVMATVNWIAENDLNEVRLRTGTSEARMSLVPLASEVLQQLVRVLRPHEIAISSYGIREGMLYDQMPAKMQKLDPLIEACKFAEAKDARRPGFGAVMHAFLSPFFRKVPAGRARSIKAACLLHDVSWRGHPDYRHEVCFDYVTRANLGGLTHTARVFVGTALLHRYKNTRSDTRFDALFGLLPEADLKQAEVLGKAMRFAAMMAADEPEMMGRLDWHPKKKILALYLPKEAEGLFGEVAQARFANLAAALAAEPVVKRKRKPEIPGNSA